MTATKYVAHDDVILVDEKDQEIGVAEKLVAHQQGLLHRAFSIFIFREQPQFSLLLQQRALSKYHSPGLWTNTCCSHPRPQETIIAAGERRLQEEIGIKTRLKDIGWFHYTAHFPNGLIENEIDHVLVGLIRGDEKIEPNPEEVHALHWIRIEELQEEIEEHPEKFTPWLEKALHMVRKIFK